MKYCSHCGQPLPDDNQKYCSHCGAPVKPEGAEHTSRPGGSSDRSSRMVPILLGVVVICLVLGTLARIISSRIEEKTASAPSVSSTSSAPSAPASQSQDAASGGEESPASDPWTDGVEPAAPDENQTAQASDTQVVLRNVPANATLTVDGRAVAFSPVGEDAVVSRDSLPDVCIVRAIVPKEDGGWQTAAAWYNESYGNDLTLGDPDQYGAYTDCDETGLCQPSYKVVDVLTWAYYTGFLNCINSQSMGSMVYSTQTNTADQQEHVFSPENAKNLYDTSNYQAVCQESSLQYSDGLVRYNATFVTYATNRTTGLQKQITNHRTIELAWQNGMWMVNRMAFLSDEDFSAGRYAQLP